MDSKYENTQSFDTLIKGKAPKDPKQKWYPTSVETFRNALTIPQDTTANLVLHKNISYSLQYLQFLQKQLDELELTPALHAMIVKAYIITGMSVLEGLFTYIIKKYGWWKTTNLEEVKDFTFTSNAKKNRENGNTYVAKTTLYKEIPTRELEPYEVSLDSMIKTLDYHQKTFRVDYHIYKPLKEAKQLRNRIHLDTAADDIRDNDYNVFSDDAQKEMKKILYEILTSESISTNPKVFDSFKPKENIKK